MKKEEFENIVNLQNNLKEQPNSKLIEVMDILTTDFELTKENIINFLGRTPHRIKGFYKEDFDVSLVGYSPQLLATAVFEYPFTQVFIDFEIKPADGSVNATNLYIHSEGKPPKNPAMIKAIESLVGGKMRYLKSEDFWEYDAIDRKNSPKQIVALINSLPLLDSVK